jgi:hypothetical protein
VRWRPSDEEFEVVGHGRMWFSDQTTVTAAAEVIEPASLTEPRRAVDRCRHDMYDGEYRFEIYDAPAEQLARDVEMFMPRPVSVELADRRTILNLAHRDERRGSTLSAPRAAVHLRLSTEGRRRHRHTPKGGGSAAAGLTSCWCAGY